MVTEWTQVGRYQAEERFQQAALRTDGRLCYLNDGDIEYIWDIFANKIVWQANENASPLITQSTTKLINVTEGSIAGKFRGFGLLSNYPIMDNGDYGIALGGLAEHPRNHGDLYILELLTKEFEHFRFDDYSGDWAFATFSDDGAIVAVLTPYVVTFYGR